MENLIKNFVKNKVEKARILPIMALVSIILLIFKFIFKNEFMDISQNIFSNINNFKFIINSISVFFIALFITSVMIFVAFCIIFILYVIDCSTCKITVNFNLLRFFIGSQNLLININMWLLVMYIYVYIVNEKYFFLFSEKIYNFIINKGNILIILTAIYILGLLLAVIYLFKILIFKFLYFKLEEEIKKMHINKEE